MAKKGKVIMPDLIGLDPERAASELRALGLIVQKERRGAGDVSSGKVCVTYPDAGQETSSRSSVVLYIKRHPLLDAFLELLPFS